MRFLVLLPLLAACGVDNVGSNGELGHLSFSLVSDWYLDETELTAVTVVTGHAQSFGVGLTNRGEDLADDQADEIEYSMDPDVGVTIQQSGPADDDVEDPGPPSLALTVTEPGSYTLVANLEGRVFDRIQLAFDAPDALDLALYTRAPWAEDFEALVGPGPSQVREGTQLAWLPIPVSAEGVRLAGDVGASMTADPIEAVVPADNVTHVNEDEVFDASNVPSLYFIEPGDVTITIGDTANPAVGTHPFVVLGE
ncbi:MAG: hypothetical protein Q8P18_34160 [Pseudomonadota bacterium]|nr:hypothetical protein [Pseudomonadota bacterium]